jgi:hypothetical protein
MQAFRVFEWHKYVFNFKSRSKGSYVVSTLGFIQRGKYPSVEACVGTWTFFNGGYNVIEGYPFIREQAAGVIVCESHKQRFLGDVIANVVSQSVVVRQRDFAAS